MPPKISNKKSTDQVSTPIYPSKVQLIEDGSGKIFFFEEYSPRCAAITAEHFATVHYLAFASEQAALDFDKAITGKFCQDSLIRPSKRFDSSKYPYEVKVWGLIETTFFNLVRRDLARR